MITLCIAGYLLCGFLTMLIAARYMENMNEELSPVVVIMIWPIALIIGGIVNLNEVLKDVCRWAEKKY